MTILTTAQAAKILGIHQSTVNGLCRLGDIHATKASNGAWVIDGDQLAEFAKTYDNSKRPKNPNTEPVNKPVGKGWQTKYRDAPKWGSLQELETAVMRGKVKALYVDAYGVPIKKIKKGEVIK